MHGFSLITLVIMTTLWFGSNGTNSPFDKILRGGTAAPAKAGCDLRIVSWNIERGQQLTAAAAALQKMKPDIALLQEVDLNAKRTGTVNVAEKLAQAIGMNYLFAFEFEEHGQKDGPTPAYHGQALITALPAGPARIIRFKNQSGFWKPRWFLPNWGMFQRRSGGRIGLVVELDLSSHRMIVYNLHLESRGSEELRLRQIQEVIEDAKRYPAETPILLAGDLNTRVPDPPAVKALLQSGFRRAAGGEITTGEGKSLDWIFVRGPVRFSDGKIQREVHASDHFPLSVRIESGLPGCGR